MPHRQAHAPASFRFHRCVGGPGQSWSAADAPAEPSQRAHASGGAARGREREQESARTCDLLRRTRSRIGGQREVLPDGGSGVHGRVCRGGGRPQCRGRGVVTPSAIGNIHKPDFAIVYEVWLHWDNANAELDWLTSETSFDRSHRSTTITSEPTLADLQAP